MDIPTRSNSVVNTETKMYLEPALKIESDEPELIAKARELTEGITTDYKKAQAIFEYVNVNMSYDESTTYANKGALSALDSMRGVCEEFTTLFVAMCRAVNIPSRAIEGYKVEPLTESGDISGDALEGKYKLINHVWAEIYLEDFGWVPVEPTVIYLVNGERKPYLSSFCMMKNPEYIALGIYNYEKANRRILGVSEITYKENVITEDEMVPERQNKFEDISNYTWATEEIQNLYGKNIIEGYSDTIYGPENSISRIEFICMLSRLLKYYDTLYAEGGLVYYYPDYNQSHWSKNDYDYLMRCYQAIRASDKSAMGFDCITDVFGTGAINMNKPITRGEAVALMDKFLSESNEYTYFTDVTSSTKFSSSILKASANGLIQGYPDGTFKPNNSITRAEMAVILSRYITNGIYTIS